MKDALTDCLTKLVFRRKANADLQAAAAAGDAAAFADALHKQLERARRKLHNQFEDVPVLSAWASAVLLAEQPDLHSRVMDVAVVAGKKRKQKTALQALQQSLDEVAAADDFMSPGVAILTAEILLRYGPTLSAEQTVAMYRLLVRAAETDWTPDELPESPSPEDAICTLAANAEAPFVLSLLLEDLQITRSLTAAGCRAAAAALDDATDTDGTLAAALGRSADDWLAPFVRMAAWSKAFRVEWADEKTAEHFADTVGYVARLITADGVLGRPKRTDIPSIEDEHAHLIMQHAARLAGFGKSSAVASVTSRISGGGKKKKKNSAASVRCSDQSDWAEVALLRRGLTADSDVVSVEWDGHSPKLHVAARGARLLGGAWNSQVIVGGEEHQTAGQWVCTCWFEDKDVAFAELEAGAEDGVRHVRHVMLSLRNHFAVLTDTITSPDADAGIEVETSVPIAGGITVSDNPVTRELVLKNRAVSCRAFPLWLADDRVQSAAGNFKQVDQQLVATAESQGGVTVPVLLDWHPDRQRRDADWNRLTVTEARRVVSPREAAGYRVRIADLQLLLYRSLQPGDDLRAVMGLHTANETVYGSVGRDGQIDPLVLVEAEA